MDTVVSRIISTMGQKGINGVQLGELLGKKKSPVTDWKNGKSKPTLEQVICICENFAISADYLLFGVENLPPTLRGDEKRLLHLYNEMDSSGRRRAMIEMFRLLQRRKEDAEWWETHEDTVTELMEKSFGPNWREMPTGEGLDSPIPLEDTIDDFERDDTPYPILKSLPRYSIRPSAGTGSFLDSSDYELIDLPVDKVPIQATFCVSINGDSMTPDYQDNDIVFVKQQPTIEHNEVGIFLFNGEVYFKKYWIEGDLKFLYSRNKKYEPIPIKEHDELRVIGKVIGKYVEQKPIDLELAFLPYPPSMDKFPEWFDARAAAANAGIKPEKWSDEDVVKPGDPEFDMPISWAAQGGHVDEEAYERVADGLRLFEKKARLASEKGAQKDKKKKNTDEE